MTLFQKRKKKEKKRGNGSEKNHKKRLHFMTDFFSADVVIIVLNECKIALKILEWMQFSRKVLKLINCTNIKIIRNVCNLQLCDWFFAKTEVSGILIEVLIF